MKLKLVDDWRDWWRWWSTWVASAASGVILWIGSSPESAIATIIALPKPLRLAACAGIAVLWLLSRILKQEKADAGAKA